MSNDRLQGRDYILLIDKSGSMDTPHKDGKTRYQNAEEWALAFATKMQGFDPDGIDVIPFSSGPHKVFTNTTPDKVRQVFAENDAMGTTDTAGALKVALDLHFSRNASGEGRPTSIVVITDGAPNDKAAVAKEIIEAANKIKEDNDLGITFLQIGDDAGATQFLRSLDDDLQAQGAKFDIVDAKTEEEALAIGNIAEILIAGLDD